MRTYVRPDMYSYPTALAHIFPLVRKLIPLVQSGEYRVKKIYSIQWLVKKLILCYNKNMNTGERIKRECERHNLPLKRVEEDCGLSNGYLHNLIKRGNKPSGERLQVLADYFEVTPEYLLGISKVTRETAQIATRLNGNEKMRELFDLIYDASDKELNVLLAVAKLLQ